MRDSEILRRLQMLDVRLEGAELAVLWLYEVNNGIPHKPKCAATKWRWFGKARTCTCAKNAIDAIVGQIHAGRAMVAQKRLATEKRTVAR